MPLPALLALPNVLTALGVGFGAYSVGGDVVDAFGFDPLGRRRRAGRDAGLGVDMLLREELGGLVDLAAEEGLTRRLRGLGAGEIGSLNVDPGGMGELAMSSLSSSLIRGQEESIARAARSERFEAGLEEMLMSMV